ncbi:MAG: hypothetical protein LHW56_08485, partial [Candidatus Cloacimonetes bacterium]|nr:hypothetical protein [Candidatus Cloacimonadota bacterium]MDY0172931.1 hypothetical protein [Candidatus Cloacimonadaceae bacterium]
SLRIAGVSPAEQETCSLFRLYFKPTPPSSRPLASFDARRIESCISPVQSFGQASIQPAQKALGELQSSQRKPL